MIGRLRHNDISNLLVLFQLEFSSENASFRVTNGQLSNPIKQACGFPCGNIRWLQNRYPGISIAARSGKLNIDVLPGRSLTMGKQCRLIGIFATRKMSYQKADPLSKKRPTVTESQRNYPAFFF